MYDDPRLQTFEELSKEKTALRAKINSGKVDEFVFNLRQKNKDPCYRQDVLDQASTTLVPKHASFFVEPAEVIDMMRFAMIDAVD